MIDELKKKAEAGDADAQYNLGVCYYKGDGVEIDYEKAVYWLKKAAEQGYTKAQYKLALCYQRGDGVKQNYEEAVSWFRKAVRQWHKGASSALEGLML